MKEKGSKWKKNEELRMSSPQMIRSALLLDLYGEDPDHPQESFRQRVNRKFNKYKEIKSFCKFTHIEPFFYLIIISILLLFVIVGFFDNYITIILATFYPLYMSFKALQFRIGEEKPDGTIFNDQDEHDDIIRWLCYWICYSVLINIESVFGNILKKVPLYFFFKIIFLLLCFMPHCQFSSHIYDNYVKKIFSKYEKKIVDYSSEIVRKFTEDEERKKGNINQKRKSDEEYEKEMQNYINKSAINFLLNKKFK